MECKEEGSPIEIKPKIETIDAQPPPTQSTPPSVIKRLQITTAGTIVEKNDDQPPEPSTEEVVNTSSSTPQEQSPEDQTVSLQEISQNPEIIQQEAPNQFVERPPFTATIQAENFQGQGDFSHQEIYLVSR